MLRSAMHSKVTASLGQLSRLFEQRLLKGKVEASQRSEIMIAVKEDLKKLTE